MTLAEHLRELRSRLVKSILAVIAGGVVGLVFYQQIIERSSARSHAAAEAQDLDAEINFGAIADPFIIPLKIALLVGLDAGRPVWIYQLWAFVTPGLYRNERKWAAAVVLISVPLFLAGIALCFWLLPKRPDASSSASLRMTSATSSCSATTSSFVMRLVLVFGRRLPAAGLRGAAERGGVLSRETLSNTRRWTVLGIFVFAAVATPTGDPITMLMLAGPMWILFEAAVLVCRFNDRRRAREAGPAIDDDVASALELASADPSDDLPSRLDDDVT